MFGGLLLSTDSHAQQPGEQQDVPEVVRTPIFESMDQDDHPSQSRTTKAMTARQLRTARAIYRANQRVARLEQNLWMGHEPLRPRWNSIPMMSSRYSNPKVYVPVYIYNR